ncbi:MAG: hypothetical protein LUD72_07815 [Bacteroidales bacterium]|nr:hypothetical protein [Bacteroidales bacterium]
MANDAQNVNVGKPNTAGAIYVAPYGTALPTGAADELNAAFASLGYISEDGLVNSNAPESTDIKAWGGDVVYTTQTDKEDTFQFTMIESGNIEVLKAVYGDANVSEDNGVITIKANSSERDTCSWVIDTIMRGTTLKRIVIPSAKVSEMDDISYKDDEAIGYGVTIKANPDGDGNTHYEYIQDANAATPTSVKTTSSKKSTTEA